MKRKVLTASRKEEKGSSTPVLEAIRIDALNNGLHICLGEIMINLEFISKQNIGAVLLVQEGIDPGGQLREHPTCLLRQPENNQSSFRV